MNRLTTCSQKGDFIHCEFMWISNKVNCVTLFQFLKHKAVNWLLGQI